VRALLLAAALAASEAPLPSDAVRDEATAISIAKKACASFSKASPDAERKVTFYNRAWHVSVQLRGHLGSVLNPPYGASVDIRAVDGTPGECLEWVTVY